jgi:hypothetical protein
MSNLEGYAPLFYLSFENLTRKLVENSLPATRPMDNVPLTPDEPIEEEYAVGAISKYSFYNAFIFPRNFDLYSKYNSFEDCPAKDRKKWKKIYHFIIQKLTFKHNGKQLVLKNPPNAYRIPYLLEMYPNAKFIFTYRNPYTLFPSMWRFYKKTMEIFALQHWNEDQIKQGYLRNYQEMITKLDQDRKLIPPNNYIEIPYEEFIRTPLLYMEKIYDQFDLSGFTEVRAAMEKYISDQQNYQPNQYSISEEIVRLVNENWNSIRRRFDYTKRKPSSSRT